MNRSAAALAVGALVIFVAMSVFLVRGAMDFEPADVLGEIEELYDADH